jgi:hypothetical protein
MNPIVRFCVLIVTLSLVSCSESLHTFSDRDPKIDIKAYKSYAWVAPGDTVLNAERKDKVYGNLIVNSANAELKKKGMMVDVNSPDALFSFETKVEEKAQYSRAPMTGGYGYVGPGYYVGGSGPMVGAEVLSKNYEEGLLYFNMHDTKTGKLIWSGGATRKLTSSDDIEKVIKTAVKQTFMRLPVKHKAN